MVKIQWNKQATVLEEQSFLLNERYSFNFSVPYCVYNYIEDKCVDCLFGRVFREFV